MGDPGRPEIHAAGAVMWRLGAQGAAEIALVHRPRYDDWSFPKGKRAAGEHVLLAAVREVSEETGVRPVLGRRLPSTFYASVDGPKRVDYWAARPAGPGREPAAGGLLAEFTPNDEVDGLVWLPVAAARGQLSYAHDRAVLDSFAAGPASTAPVILVRHASAVSKRAWRHAGHGDDLARPLTAEGLAQAEALGSLLGCFPPARVVSSGAERCLATVRPYAARTGGAIETEPEFTLDVGPGPDGAGWTASRAARDQAKALVATAVRSQPVIVCAHRQNLPSLLAWACDQLGAPALNGPGLGKGAFWILHVGAAGLAAAERHDAGASP